MFHNLSPTDGQTVYGSVGGDDLYTPSPLRGNAVTLSYFSDRERTFASYLQYEPLESPADVTFEIQYFNGNVKDGASKTINLTSYGVYPRVTNTHQMSQDGNTLIVVTLNTQTDVFQIACLKTTDRWDTVDVDFITSTVATNSSQIQWQIDDAASVLVCHYLEDTTISPDSYIRSYTIGGSSFSILSASTRSQIRNQYQDVLVSRDGTKALIPTSTATSTCVHHLVDITNVSVPLQTITDLSHDHKPLYFDDDIIIMFGAAQSLWVVSIFDATDVSQEAAFLSSISSDLNLNGSYITYADMGFFADRDKIVMTSDNRDYYCVIAPKNGDWLSTVSHFDFEGHEVHTGPWLNLPGCELFSGWSRLYSETNDYYTKTHSLTNNDLIVTLRGSNTYDQAIVAFPTNNNNLINRLPSPTSNDVTANIVYDTIGDNTKLLSSPRTVHLGTAGTDTRYKKIYAAQDADVSVVQYVDQTNNNILFDALVLRGSRVEVVHLYSDSINNTSRTYGHSAISNNGNVIVIYDQVGTTSTSRLHVFHTTDRWKSFSSYTTQSLVFGGAQSVPSKSVPVLSYDGQYLYLLPDTGTQPNIAILELDHPNQQYISHGLNFTLGTNLPSFKEPDSIVINKTGTHLAVNFYDLGSNSVSLSNYILRLDDPISPTVLTSTRLQEGRIHWLSDDGQTTLIDSYANGNIRLMEVNSSNAVDDWSSIQYRTVNANTSYSTFFSGAWNMTATIANVYSPLISYLPEFDNAVFVPTNTSVTFSTDSDANIQLSVLDFLPSPYNWSWTSRLNTDIIPAAGEIVRPTFAFSQSGVWLPILSGGGFDDEVAYIDKTTFLHLLRTL